MKDFFWGYIKKTEEEIKAIWDNGLITFDANVLLNLYRYSTETREELLKLFGKLSGKIFITHQAALEFHRNRFDEIFKQEKIYKDFISSFKKIEEDLSSKRHPFLSKKLSTKLNKVFDEAKEEISKNSSFYGDLLRHDVIYEEINTLFVGKIQAPYNNNELEEIYKEGKKRFENKIPPGFEDEHKDNNRKYGDLILWKQILTKAKTDSKPIILVTDDNKKDWWWKFKDNDRMTIGPRYELIEEIKNHAGVGFQMYNPDKFLEFGLKYVNEAKNSKAVDELREIRMQKGTYINDNEYDKVISLINNFDKDFDSILKKKFIENEIKELNMELLKKFREFEKIRFGDSKDEIEIKKSELDLINKRITELQFTLISLSHNNDTFNFPE